MRIISSNPAGFAAISSRQVGAGQLAPPVRLGRFDGGQEALHIRGEFPLRIERI